MTGPAVPVWNPAPGQTGGIPNPACDAQRPLRAVDVPALIQKRIG